MNEKLQVIIDAEISKFKKNITDALNGIEDFSEKVKKASKDVDSFTKTVDNQSKELKDLKQKYIDIVAAQGSQSEAAKKCAAQITKLSGELKVNGERLNAIADEADSFDVISQAIKKEERALLEAKKAQEELAKAQKEAQEAAERQESALESLGETARNALAKGFDIAKKAIAAASAAIGLVTKGTEQYRTEQAKLTTAFEAAGASAEEAKVVYDDLYRVIGESDRAVETANHIAQLTTNQKEMAEWTNICQGVFATFGDSLPIEGLTEAANETAKVGKVTGVLADALNWAGVSEEQFNEKLAACNTEAEREALIRTTLNGLYDEAAKKFETNNAEVIKQREEQAKLQETLAKVGEALAPLVTTFTQFANDVLAKVLPYIQDLAEKYGPGLADTLSDVAEVTERVVNFVINNFAFIASIAGVIAGITAALTLYNTVQKIKNALNITETVTVGALTSALWAQITAMAAAIAPYLAIVAAIGVVIGIGVLLYKNWDTIKQKAGELWQGITKTFDNIKKSISEKIDGAKNKVKETIDKIKGFFNFKWELPKLKMPHVKIKGEFSLVPPKVPTFSIDWYAQGGVFDSPTLFNYGNRIGGLGEAGAEAIVPLEKNTQWLDKIADKLASKSGSTPIILQVDGKTFAQTSVSTINQLTKQTGKLELQLY